jgi:hypothetical protein
MYSSALFYSWITIAVQGIAAAPVRVSQGNWFGKR